MGFIVKIKNFGQTNAYNVDVRTGYYSAPIKDGEKVGALPENANYAISSKLNPSGSGLEAVGILAPGQEANALSHADKITFSEDFLKKNSVFMIGEIHYSDTYGHRHVFDFCYVFIPDADAPLDFRATGPHNEEHDEN